MTISVVLLGLLIPSSVLAADACHAYGGVDSCCENEGYGFKCAYCPGMGYCTGSNPGAACDTSWTGCGGRKDCKSFNLGKLGSIANFYYSGTGSAQTDTTTVVANLFPTYSESGACPLFGCYWRVPPPNEVPAATIAAQYGLSLSNGGPTPQIIYDDSSCTQCSYANQDVDIVCYSYLSADG